MSKDSLSVRENVRIPLWDPELVCQEDSKNMSMHSAHWVMKPSLSPITLVIPSSRYDL